jgi:sensor histidine kinase regulating citrate/malate metabolism
MKIFEGAQNCSDPPCLEKEELVTFEKVGMDFVSLKGIQTKIGVSTDKLLIFVLKELVDNALDFIDRSGKPNPVLIVSIREEGNKIKVTVANSDFGLANSGFTEPSVRNIFNLAGYYST